MWTHRIFKIVKPKIYTLVTHFILFCEDVCYYSAKYKIGGEETIEPIVQNGPCTRLNCPLT